MKLIVDVPNSLYANLSAIKNESVAGKRILECVKNGTLIKTGQWIKIDTRIKYNLYVWKATCCGREFIADADLKIRDNYCLNCGAKIKSEDKE